MEEGYLRAAHNADKAIQSVLAILPSEARVVVMTDHGGHDRTHGLDCPADKQIPLLIHSPGFTVNWGEDVPTLLDIAPTLATLCGVSIPTNWEGRSLVTPSAVFGTCFNLSKHD